MFSIIRKFFNADTNLQERNDEFIWELAEALLWRDEEVSLGAIPSPIKMQPEASRYYDDARYLIDFVTKKEGE